MAYQELKKCYGQKLNPNVITKVIICEIYKHASKESTNTAAHWLSEWSGVNLEGHILPLLRVKMKRISKHRKKLRGAKLTKFLTERFSFPKSGLPVPKVTETYTTTYESEVSSPPVAQPNSSTCGDGLNRTTVPISGDAKNDNFLSCEISWKRKHFEILQKAIKDAHDDLGGLNVRKCYLWQQ